MSTDRHVPQSVPEQLSVHCASPPKRDVQVINFNLIAFEGTAVVEWTTRIDQVTML